MTLLVLDETEAAVARLFADRPLAHETLFGERHPSATPPFHAEIVTRFHSPLRATCDIAFRGSAKSTIAEEAVTLMAAFREFKHCILVGSSLDRACERLHAVRRQFEQNEFLALAFGNLRGHPWGDEYLELATGITIKAVGRGQALRGTKDEASRPDLIVADDIEDRVSMSTAAGIEKVQNWFFGELLPAGDEPNLRVRMIANDMGVECLGNRLKRADSGFEVHTYPWLYIDDTGLERSIWPARYPIETIHAKRRQMRALGRAAEYNQEYMCRSETPEEKPFKRDMMKTEPMPRLWQVVYGSFDPARRLGEGAAQTGFAAWSWVGSRMIVWDAWGRRMLPDEIVAAIVDFAAEYSPVRIGIDETGLNEWIMQPLRREQARRGLTVPIVAVPQSKSKADRIRGLQPYFAAREVTFAKPLPELESQLVGYPAGLRDIVDALANALIMRPGAPVYEDFSARHVVSEMRPAEGVPVHLALNATPAATSGVIVQFVNDGIRVYGDFYEEAPPADALGRIVRAAGLKAERTVRCVAGPEHFDRYGNVGLAQAARALPVEIGHATAPERGAREIRKLLRIEVKGRPALLIDASAHWTLNGFAGGYSRKLGKGGILADEAEDGPYRILMEGLESYAGMTALGAMDDGDSGMLNAVAASGQRYFSARPGR